MIFIGFVWWFCWFYRISWFGSGLLVIFLVILGLTLGIDMIIRPPTEGLFCDKFSFYPFGLNY